ncbi:MAG: alpha-glucoside transport system substrate-binding protein [Micromonosporaceae bacterium]|nr:alpha-glucoside transport system substrate-binding protein [Micromonosporaceae bacterium]
MRLRHHVVGSSAIGARRRRGLLVLASAVAAITALGACTNTPGTSAGPVPKLTGVCAKYQAYAGLAGTKVTMFASIISPESDSLQTSWSEFSKCTGITISYEGANDFESQLPVRVTGGNAPDLAIIPQPGLLQQMVKSGKVAKPADQTVANVDKYWNKTWKAYGTVNGTFYAAPMSANMKSLVWYSPKAFTAAGVKVPTTWTEMMAISDTIAATGKKPWCGGIGSGTATGWPATDWLEQVVLRSGGGDVYDKWVNHTIKFNSPEITGAMQTVAGWMLNPKYVNGGFGDVKSVATTTFQDAGKPILTGGCYMLQQASFYGAQWPKGTKIAADGDVFAFYLPPINSSVPTPVIGGGEFLTAFASRPEVQAVQSYLSTPAWATNRIKAATGWVSANTGADQSAYTDPIDKLSAKYLTDTSATFRFDASDLMPAAVGAGTEWKAMTAWFAEGKSIQQVANDIDAGFPS